MAVGLHETGPALRRASVLSRSANRRFSGCRPALEPRSSVASRSEARRRLVAETTTSDASVAHMIHRRLTTK
jgi:hypothetical protein